MDKLDRIITQGTRAALGALMCLMILLVFAQVIFRYFVGLTPFFIEEVSRGLLIWVGCFGASLALRTSQHVGVDFFLGYLPGGVMKKVKRLGQMSVLLFLLFFLFASAKYSLFQMGQQSASLPISMFWFYLALPLGSLLMILQMFFGLRKEDV